MALIPMGRVAGAALYGLLVFGGTAVLGFVVLPPLGYAAGLFTIETDARAAFSLVTLAAVPLLAGLSAGAGLSYDWLTTLSRVRRLVVYAGTTATIWIVGAAVMVYVLG